MPAGVAAFFLAKLVTLLFDDLPAGERRVAVASAVAIGVTSAMGIATLGTTMNEWPGAALVAAALWLVVRALVHGQASGIGVRTLVIAGLLVGIATGGKLTAAVFAVGLCVALGVRTPQGPSGWRGSVREAAIFAGSVFAGLLIALGPWAYALAAHYGNPFFPYFNEWVRSPWWDAAPLYQRAYGPHSFEGWLLFPFHLVGPGEHFVTEVPYRDGRFPLAWGLAIVAGADVARVPHRRPALPQSPRGVSAAWRLTGVFIATAFLVWTAQHSVYRYIVLLDLLTGAVIVTLLARLVRPGYLPAIATVAAMALIATTRYGNWWHVEFGDRWFDVRVPQLPPDALVLLTTDAPLAYMLPMMSTDARFVGARNTIVDPGRRNKLAQSVRVAVRDHKGPVYQLTSPLAQAGMRLQRTACVVTDGGCVPVQSNIHKRRVELCRLSRMQEGASP